MAGLFPPVDPDTNRGRPRRRLVPFTAVLPNLVTLLALCAGLTAMRMAHEQRFDLAVAAIMLAIILDGVDGRLARYFRATSKFGEQLDSLADFVNFGVAPGLFIFIWKLDALSSFGWICALVFAICCGLRLARFNVALDETERPKWMSNYFVGIPAPAGACTLMLPLYLHFIGTPRFEFVTAGMVILYTLFVAYLMISRVPTFSGKLVGQKIDRRWVTPLFLCFVMFLGLLATFPWSVLTVCCFLYFGVIPFSVIRFRSNSRRTMKGGVAEEADTDGASKLT